jgi:hypothetical protein
MSPWRWWLRRRAERKADREAIAAARAEQARAGDEPAKSLGETVMDASGEFPSQS